MESNPPVIQSYARYVAKDTAFAAEYEDAFRVGLEQGCAAIADGVSSAIFSGRWARILVRKVVEDPPDLSQPDGWVKWLADPRRLWLEDIDFPRMPQNQKAKLRQVGGAYCTLCWVEFHSLPDQEARSGRCTLRAYAMGDSCLLLIRSGRLLTSFPLAKAVDFDLDPDSICSVASSRDGQQSLAVTDIDCLDGDVVVLVTDAIGKWMLECVEAGQPTPWEQLWTLAEGDWAAAIERLREANAMKRDDTTMVVLQVGEGPPVWLEAPSADSGQAAPTQNGVGSVYAEAAVNETAVVDAEDAVDAASAEAIEDALAEEVFPEEVLSQEAEPLVVFGEADSGESGAADGDPERLSQGDKFELEVASKSAVESTNAENDATGMAASETVPTPVDGDRGPIGNFCV